MIPDYIGRVGKDAVTRHTSGGKPVTGFSVAFDSGYGDSKQTLWFDCNAWGERYEKLAEYIKKGDNIGVAGEIGEREHEGKTYKTLRVSDVKLLSSKRDASANNSQRSTGNPKQADASNGEGAAFDDDDIPIARIKKRAYW